MRNARTERELRRELDVVHERLGRLGPDGPAGDKGLAGDLVEDSQTVEAQAGGELAYGRLARRARTIQKALTQLEDGRYGRCEECAGAIPVARLRAMPDATTCLRCQEAKERTRLGADDVAPIPRITDVRRRGRGRRLHHVGRAVARYSD
jgi:RNA polymerase-binding transcription factor DksA